MNYYYTVLLTNYQSSRPVEHYPRIFHRNAIIVLKYSIDVLSLIIIKSWTQLCSRNTSHSYFQNNNSITKENRKPRNTEKIFSLNLLSSSYCAFSRMTLFSLRPKQGISFLIDNACRKSR